MTTLNRLVISWEGSMVVGSAVSVLHFDGSDNAAPPVAAIKTAFSNATLMFPSGLNIVIPNTGDQIESTTGNLSGVWSTTGGGTVAGGNTVPPAAGVGACIGWTTGGIVNGTKGPRKLRGRTFLVPLSTAVYESNGTLSTSALTSLQTLADAIRTSGPLGVWHRPTTPGGTDGNSYGVQSGRVRDKVAYLSSRRD